MHHAHVHCAIGNYFNEMFYDQVHEVKNFPFNFHYKKKIQFKFFCLKKIFNFLFHVWFNFHCLLK